MGTESMIKLEKSKLSPKFVEIPCYIDATTGGRIDEVDSFVRYLANKGIVKTGSWYSISDTIDKMIGRYPVLDRDDLKEHKKNYRKNDMYALIHENEDLKNLLQVCLIDFIDDIYPMQRDVNNDYQKQLMKECKFFEGQEISDDSE